MSGGTVAQPLWFPPTIPRPALDWLTSTELIVFPDNIMMLSLTDLTPVVLVCYSSAKEYGVKFISGSVGGTLSASLNRLTWQISILARHRQVCEESGLR